MPTYTHTLTEIRNMAIMALCPFLFASDLAAQQLRDIPRCPGALEYEPLVFSFSESWMNDYSFWIDASLGFDLLVPQSGVLFYDINGQPQSQHATIRMMTAQGECILQVETRSLGAESLQSFIASDPADGAYEDYEKAINELVGFAIPPADHERTVFVDFTTEQGAINVISRSALVLDGSVIYIN